MASTSLDWFQSAESTLSMKEQIISLLDQHFTEVMLGITILLGTTMFLMAWADEMQSQQIIKIKQLQDALAVKPKEIIKEIIKEVEVVREVDHVAEESLRFLINGLRQLPRRQLLNLVAKQDLEKPIDRCTVEDLAIGSLQTVMRRYLEQRLSRGESFQTYLNSTSWPRKLLGESHHWEQVIRLYFKINLYPSAEDDLD